MEAGELDREYWRYRQGLADWSFRLAIQHGEAPQGALRRHVQDALAAVLTLANVKRIEWITESEGDDAAVLTPAGPADRGDVDAVFDRLDDVVQVSADLDLRCVSTQGVEFLVRQGASLSVDLFPPEGDATSPRVILRLRLDVDLYSPRTLGEKRDNPVLAAADGPRLTAFLRFVRNTRGGEIDSIEAPSYEEWVTDEGFRLSDPATSSS